MNTVKTQARYRYSVILLKQLVETDFKLRYQGSILGYLWSLLRPLAIFTILYVVFARFLRFGDSIPYFPVYLLLGVVLWNYFAEVTSSSVGAIVGKGDLLRKINFPKYVIVLAGSFSALINLVINMLVIGIFMVILGVDIHMNILLFPLVLAQLFVLSLAMAFGLSAIFVRFRDVNYIWEVVMQGMFYAIPIIYPLAMIPEKAAKILLLNPLAQIIQDARYVLISPETTTLGTLYHNPFVRLVPYGITVLLLVWAVFYFKKRAKHFAEEV